MSLKTLKECLDSLEKLDYVLIPERVDQITLTAQMTTVSNIIERMDVLSQFRFEPRNKKYGPRKIMGKVVKILEGSFELFFNIPRIISRTYKKPEYEAFFTSALRCFADLVMLYFPSDPLDYQEREAFFDMIDVLLSLVKDEDDHSAAKVFGVSLLAQVLLFDDVAVYAVRKGVQVPIVRTFNKMYEHVDKLFLPYPNITCPAMVNFGPDFIDISNTFMDPKQIAEKERQLESQRKEELFMRAAQLFPLFDNSPTNSGVSPFYYDNIKTEPSRPPNTTTSSRGGDSDNNKTRNNDNNDDVEMSATNNSSLSSSASTTTNERETRSSSRMETDDDDDRNNNNNNSSDSSDDDSDDSVTSEEDSNPGYGHLNPRYGPLGYRTSDPDDRNYTFIYDNDDIFMADRDGVDSDLEGDDIPDVHNNEISKEKLLQAETLGIIKSLGAIGEYQEVIPVLFEHHGFETVLGFLRSRNPFILSEILYTIGHLMAHKKFGRDFIERGGLRLTIAVPPVKYLAGGLAKCISGLAANLQVIEQICLLPNPYPTRLISHAKQLIGVTDSSTKMISQFFSEALTFRAVIEIFEEVGGFEALFYSFSDAVTGDKRDLGVSLALCLRQHFRTAFLLRFYTYKLGVDRQSEGGGPGTSAPIPGYKSVDTEERAMEEALESLEEMRRSRERAQQGDSERDSDDHYYQLRRSNHQFQQQKEELRQPPPLSLENVRLFNRFFSIDGMRKVLKAIDTYNGIDSSTAEDLVQYCLDVIHVATFTPQGRETLLKPISDDKPTVGMAAVLNAVRKEDNPGIMITALNTIVNCVYSQQDFQQQQQQEQLRGEDGAPMNILTCLRNLDGVNVFIKLLTYSWHMDAADEVHKLACRALLGMTCDQPISQILSTLDISSILAGPLKQPAHPDKVRHYKAFRQYGIELISKITGHIPTHLIRDATDTAQKKMDRASIVSKTVVKYNEPELLQVVHDFLVSSGLQNSADALAKEANLPKSGSRGGTGSNETEHPQTLNDIVTQYLRNQHEQCSHPIAVLPPFSLLERHKCPEPHEWYAGTHTAPQSITSRLFHRELAPPYGGLRGHKQDTHFVHSRFKHVVSVEDVVPASVITSTAMYDNNHVMVGLDTGHVYLWNTWEQKVAQRWEVLEDSPINDIRIIGENNDPYQRAIFSFKGTRRDEPCSVVTDLADKASLGKKLLTFQGAYALRYSNDRRQIVATKEKLAIIHDAETGDAVRELTDARHETEPRYFTFTSIASFSPNDTLVLNDNALWDPRAPRLIHKFDKFTNYGSGYFNPRGTDVIINSEIWDLRTFKLINTCPSLLHAHVDFNATGEVIYATTHRYNEDARRFQSHVFPYRSCFFTIDASDFSLINSMDVGRSIIHLSIDRGDDYLSLVEDDIDTPGDSTHCRIYEIGNKPKDDEAAADENMEDDDISNDNSRDGIDGGADDDGPNDDYDMFFASDSDYWDGEDEDENDDFVDRLADIIISHSNNNSISNGDSSDQDEEDDEDEEMEEEEEEEDQSDTNQNNGNDQNGNGNNRRGGGGGGSGSGRRSRRGRRQLDFHESNLNDEEDNH